MPPSLDEEPTYYDLLARALEEELRAQARKSLPSPPPLVELGWLLFQGLLALAFEEAPPTRQKTSLALPRQKSRRLFIPGLLVKRSYHIHMVGKYHIGGSGLVGLFRPCVYHPTRLGVLEYEEKRRRSPPPSHGWTGCYLAG